MSVVLRGVSGNQADVDATGALKIQGTFSATVTATEESVGATSIAIPAKATLIGGPDAGGLMRAPAVLNTTPAGTEYALVVRQVGSTGGGLTNAELRASPVPTSFKDTLNQDIVFLNTVPTGLEMAMPIRQIGGINGTIDPNNTSTTPLAANAVFTGATTDCLGVVSISFSVSSDVISAVAGIKVQWSADGIHWSTRGFTQLTSTRVGQDQATDLNVHPHDRYFRIEYTNGATPQTFFRLQTILNNYTVTGDSKGVDQVPVSGDDALLTKAVITGKNTNNDGTYIDARVNPLGFLAVGGIETMVDAEVNPTDCVAVAAHNSLFNGTTWDRARGTIANGALVDVSRIQGSVAVTGTFWQATQPVSISSSIALAVTGTFWQATQPVSIASSVAVTGPLTDTQLRATPVPVTVNSVNSSATGNITANGQAITMTAGNDESFGIQITGTWVGSMEIQGSIDGGANWIRLECFRPDATGAEDVTSTATINGVYQPLNPQGMTHIRAHAFAWTSGTAAIVISGTAAGLAFSPSLRENSSSIASYANQMGASDGTFMRFVKSDTLGNLYMQGLGTAGVSTGGVLSIQGVAGGVALPVSDLATGTPNTAAPTKAQMVGGSDGTNLQTFKTDAAGRIVTLQLSDTPNVTRVATSTASAQLLVANANRKGVIIVNESSGVMYLKFGTTASSTSYTYRLVSNAVVEIAFGYTGRIDAILNTGSGNAQITELT
jgi:hypothetical protein